MARARSNPNWALRICLVALVLSVAWFVTRPKPLAGWLSVQADSHAVRTLPFHVRVELTPTDATSEFLVADLHWATRRHEPRGFLSAGAPQQLSPTPATYDFDLLVPR